MIAVYSPFYFLIDLPYFSVVIHFTDIEMDVPLLGILPTFL